MNILSSDETSEIMRIMAIPRFARYLKYCQNNKKAALELYAYNMQISSAFIPALNVLEIVLRNAIAEQIVKLYGIEWNKNKAFINTLPNHYRIKLSDLSIKYDDYNKIIPELGLGLWGSMLRKKYIHTICKGDLCQIFPHLPHDINATYLHQNVEKIRLLRNRIAHYEPIFHLDLLLNYTNILDIIKWRCNITSAWLNDTQMVTKNMILNHHEKTHSDKIKMGFLTSNVSEGEQFSYPTIPKDPQIPI